jgi:2-polyprenyl-3-methyl-5-hydroxy-6-metoxy-1,4-benzoquinol methylase
MIKVLEDDQGRVHVTPLTDGRLQLSAEATADYVHPPHSPCVTDYTQELVERIFECYGSIYTCDEISRDVDNTEAALDVRYATIAYLDDAQMSKPLRILDYGCGAGSSTLALARLFPNADISGCDYAVRLLEIARMRAEHYALHNLSFAAVPADGASQGAVAEFDIAFLNAVFEHLLPRERPLVLESIWRSLKPGGILVLNQTPHRWFPIETHTSGLPLVNYLPDAMAHWAIGRYCRRSVRGHAWEELLRAGVRGATVREIMGLIRSIDAAAERMACKRVSPTWSGIWYEAKQARVHKIQSSVVRTAIATTGRFVGWTGLPFTPYINIAIQKSDGTTPHRTDGKL